MTLAYFVDGESAAPEDGDYDISQVMETSMWDSFVVEGWEIDRLFFNQYSIGASREYLPYSWLDRDITASCKNSLSSSTETALSEQQCSYKEHVQSSKIFFHFPQHGTELHLSIFQFV